MGIWKQTWLVHTYMAAMGVPSCLVAPAPVQAHGRDHCCGRADTLAKTHGYVCSEYNMVEPCYRPLSTTIILALLSHNNNKSACFMRTLLSALEKAATIGKGMQSFLTENLLVNFKARS